jgi:hypothetical protein
MGFATEFYINNEDTFIPVKTKKQGKTIPVTGRGGP